jgi:hypothetical protein
VVLVLKLSVGYDWQGMTGMEVGGGIMARSVVPGDKNPITKEGTIENHGSHPGYTG